MRKRDKKREKVRSETLLKKKRELYVDVVVGSEGKRGKGRRQRVSRVSSKNVWLDGRVGWWDGGMVGCKGVCGDGSRDTSGDGAEMEVRWDGGWWMVRMGSGVGGRER